MTSLVSFGAVICQHHLMDMMCVYLGSSFRLVTIASTSHAFFVEYEAAIIELRELAKAVQAISLQVYEAERDARQQVAICLMDWFRRIHRDHERRRRRGDEDEMGWGCKSTKQLAL